jgi:hypothetical protein
VPQTNEVKLISSSSSIAEASADIAGPTQALRLKRFRFETAENGWMRSACARVRLMSLQLPSRPCALRPLTTVVHVQTALKPFLTFWAGGGLRGPIGSLSSHLGSGSRLRSAVQRS